MNNYVTPRVAAKVLGVNSRTLARWESSGKIKAIKTDSGQRRYDLEAYLREHGQSEITKATVLYARVSTAAQQQDLDRQILALVSEYPVGEVITEIDSGFNLMREKFLPLMERVISGQVGCIVVAHQDRLCRFGFELIEWLCSFFDCTIVVLDEKSYSPEVELMQDLLAIVSSCTGRLSRLDKLSSQLRADCLLPTLTQAEIPVEVTSGGNSSDSIGAI